MHSKTYLFLFFSRAACLIRILEIRFSQSLAKLGEGYNFSDGGGRDEGISGLTGEVGLHGHNGLEI